HQRGRALPRGDCQARHRSGTTCSRCRPRLMGETVLGFDYGTQRIGVAVGQTITHTATPLAALHARDGVPNWDHIATLISEWRPARLVVGLPLNMDGSESEMCVRAKKFANRLHG